MRVILAVVIAATLAAAGAALAEVQSRDTPKPPASPTQKAAHETLKSPMVFYLAKGSTDSCGHDCSEWIAAEGQIVIGTADKMRAFLKRLSGPKRPIYFYSPGGIASEALTMGRLMHDGGFTAGVARTVPQGCEPMDCAVAKKAGRELKAQWKSFNSSCASACVYAFVGARHREVAPDAALGIHAAKTELIKKIPKGVRIPANFFSNFHKESNRKIARYLVDMGIKPALLEAAEKIPHQEIRALTREEIVRFGIDTRSFVESAWVFDQEIFEHGAIVKLISGLERKGAIYHTATLFLRCLTPGQMLVGYLRKLESAFEPLPGPFKISTAGKDFTLKTLSINDKDPSDIRQQRVPVSFFQTALADDHLIMSEEGGNNNPPIQISTSGLSAALVSLEGRCGYPLLPVSERASLVPSHLP